MKKSRSFFAKNAKIIMSILTALVAVLVLSACASTSSSGNNSGGSSGSSDGGSSSSPSADTSAQGILKTAGYENITVVQRDSWQTGTGTLPPDLATVGSDPNSQMFAATTKDSTGGNAVFYFLVDNGKWVSFASTSGDITSKGLSYLGDGFNDYAIMNQNGSKGDSSPLSTTDALKWLQKNSNIISGYYN